MTPVTVLDGPMGTLLAAQGLPLPAPGWTAHAVRDAPDAVSAVHRAYAEAGATVHAAATFRTTPQGIGAEAASLTRRAVQLAREAVPAGHRIAGSLAPVHDCYRPDLSPGGAEDLHRTQAQWLADSGVDLLLVETFPHVDEALTATRAAVATGLPVWTALTPGFDGSLMTPGALAAGARRVADVGATIVLVNCLPALRAHAWTQALAATGLPWGIYANAGAPESGLWHGQPGAAERYADLAQSWRRQGASVLGGCCGTGPDHIRAVIRMTKAQVAIDDARSLE